MEKLGVIDKANSYYVGDVPDDMRAAKNAGIIGVGSLPPQNKTRELKERLISAGALEVMKEINEIIAEALNSIVFLFQNKIDKGSINIADKIKPLLNRKAVFPIPSSLIN
jgi:histidinol phosphatase-like enzyme